MSDNLSVAAPLAGAVPVLPLRDVVVYPYMVTPLFVGRSKSINALDFAMSQDKSILLLTQKDAGEDDPSYDGIYKVGTLATILQLLKLPDGTIKVLVEGDTRAKVVKFNDKNKDYLVTQYELLEDVTTQDNKDNKTS